MLVRGPRLDQGSLCNPVGFRDLRFKVALQKFLAARTYHSAKIGNPRVKFRRWRCDWAACARGGVHLFGPRRVVFSSRQGMARHSFSAP